MQIDVGRSPAVRRPLSHFARPTSVAVSRPSPTISSLGPEIMTDYINAWQCIGCGKIEAPQPCIGVCKDHRVQFVYAEDYEEVLARALSAKLAFDLVRKLARTTPLENGWRGSYLAFQDEARRIVAHTAYPDAETPKVAQKPRIEREPRP